MKRLLISLLSSLLILIPAATPALAAPSTDAVCEGIGLASNGQGSGCTQTSGPTINSILRTVINILSIIVGVIAVVMIIVAGVKFVTSGGASDKVASAKNTVLYAVIGLVVVALAQVIVKFVLKKASS